MQVSYTPAEQLRGHFSNLQLTAGELATSLAAPFAPGAVDAAGADRLSRVLVDVENTLFDADVAQMVGHDFVGHPTVGGAVQQARAGIEELFDATYDASLHVREAAATGHISEGFDSGPVAQLRDAAARLGTIASDVLRASAGLA